MATRKPGRAALTNEASVYAAFFRDAPDAVVAVDEHGTIVDANEGASVLFGFEPGDLIGESIEVLVPPGAREAHARARAEYTDDPRRRPMGVGMELVAVRRDGTTFAADVSLSPLPGEGGLITLAAIRDGSRYRAAAATSAESERRFRAIFEDAPVGIALVDSDLRLIEVNDSLCQMLGHRPAELTTLTIDDLTPDEDSRRHRDLADRLFAGELTRFTVEKRLVAASGHVLWATVRVSALPDGLDAGHPAAIAIFEDITEQKQTESRLVYSATHDDLTGLANRSVLHDRVSQAITRGNRNGDFVALLFADLDGFKLVNDKWGHRFGDVVLRDVALRLASVVRPPDVAARVGGDEFAVLCEALGPDRARAHATAEEIATRIREHVQEPLEVAGTQLRVQITIGIVLARDDRRSTAALLTLADATMYAAKRDGAGYAFASTGVDA